MPHPRSYRGGHTEFMVRKRRPRALYFVCPGTEFPGSPPGTFQIFLSQPSLSSCWMWSTHTVHVHQVLFGRSCTAARTVTGMGWSHVALWCLALTLDSPFLTPTPAVVMPHTGSFLAALVHGPYAYVGNMDNGACPTFYSNIPGCLDVPVEPKQHVGIKVCLSLDRQDQLQWLFPASSTVASKVSWKLKVSFSCQAFPHRQLSLAK